MKNLKKLFSILPMIITFQTVGAQVPVLNSYSSASATIFLDFDGQTVTSIYWNGGTAFYASPSTFDATKITNIFNIVAEDYRPFNINITTDSTVYFAAPINRRMRVIVTPTSSWYGAAGGVAYIGSFTWGAEAPAFVFEDKLSYNYKSVAEAASHEAGHTLSLSHQSKYDASCALLQSYNSGAGTGEISWAPIMGVAYSRTLTLWYNGQTSSGCSVYQDDVSKISSATNGFGLRSDDIGNNKASATTANFVSSAFALNGIINSESDVDYVKFTLPYDTRFTLYATPFNVGTNNLGADVDLQITLQTSTGSVIGVYNPANYLQAAIDTNMLAGTYYIVVDGIANAYTPSDYGVMGSYTLDANISGAILPVKEFELHGRNNSGRHELSWSILTEEAFSSITVEASDNGVNFKDIQMLDQSARNFNYYPFEPGNMFYRLRATTLKGNVYYSNTITLNTSGNLSRVNIINTLVKDRLAISSSGVFDYKIIDMNGKLIQRGKLNSGINQLELSGAAAGGMYLLHTTINGEDLTQKFFKQ